jgi:hypothetical protein
LAAVTPPTPSSPAPETESPIMRSTTVTLPGDGGLLNIAGAPEDEAHDEAAVRAETAQLERLAAGRAAEHLIQAWWPGLAPAEREDLTIEFAQAHTGRLAELDFVIRGMRPAVPWTVLRALRAASWRRDFETVQPRPRPSALVRVEHHYRRLERQYRRRHDAVGVRVVRAALAGLREQLGPTGGHQRQMTPAVRRAMVGLARAISRAMPDRRRVGGAKRGVFRSAVLTRTQDILRAVYGIRPSVGAMRDALRTLPRAR